MYGNAMLVSIQMGTNMAGNVAETCVIVSRNWDMKDVWKRHDCVHADGHQHGGDKIAETSVTEFCHGNEMLLL